MLFLEQNHSLTVLAQFVFCRGDHVSQNSVSIKVICQYIEGNRTSACWLFGAVADSSLYPSIVFQCLQCSDTASRYFVCCRSCGSKLLYPILDGVAIGNPSMSPNVKMPSEYCVAIIVLLVLENISMVNARCTADHW